jgi:hypothetical protein
MKAKPAVYIQHRGPLYIVSCGKNQAVSTVLDRAIVMALTGDINKPEPKHLSLHELIQRGR